MIPDQNKKLQDDNLKALNYSAKDDIFNQEQRVSLDENGDPILNENRGNSDLDMDLDVPGSHQDDDMEKIGSEDEENNYWSISDNKDDHEEENDDIIR